MRRRPRVILTLVAIALATSVSAFAQEPDERGLGIRLLEAPEARRDDPRALVSIVDHVDPGTSFTRAIEVVNDTDDVMNVSIYGAPANLTQGAFAIGEPSEDAEITQWLRPSPESAAISPRGSIRVNAQFEVPETAEDGEYYGALVAERVSATPSSGIAVRSRAAVRVYLSVGSGTEPETDFELPAFRPIRQRDGRPAIEIDGCNTGGRAVDLSGTVELTNGPGGSRAGPFRTEQATTITPGDCHTFTIPLDKELPNGPWDATAKLRSGKEERTAEARITFPENAGERGKKVETKEVTGTVPGIIALGVSIFLLLLLAGWLLWFLLKRRKRKKDDEDEPES